MGVRRWLSRRNTPVGVFLPALNLLALEDNLSKPQWSLGVGWGGVGWEENNPKLQEVTQMGTWQGAFSLGATWDILFVTRLVA